MTKEITKAYILQEIQDKLALREFDETPFLFSEIVTPVYNIEQHLEHWEVEYETVSVTSGPLKYLFFSVPQDERWLLRAYNVVFMTGSYKVTGAFVERGGVGADTIYMDMVLNQTVSYAKNLPYPVELRYRDGIYLYVDDYTSTGSLRLYIDVRKEKIR